MLKILFSLVLLCLVSVPARAVFIDGTGHYGLQPGTQTNPGFSESEGLYQATKQSFGLLGNVKAGDALSLKLQMRIFENQRANYLGDRAQPEQCSEFETDAEDDQANAKNTGSTTDCERRHQSSSEPAYRYYRPYFSEAYIEYGTNLCLFEVGRRSRDWGLGIFLDSGRNPFDQSASIYDGATCKVNALQQETLGFAIGLDRLVETGTSIDVGVPYDSAKNGSNKLSDDMDQLFFSIMFDDTKAQDSGSLARQIGIYFANVFGSAKIGEEKKTAKTDVKFADLYTAFFYKGFSFKNETLFRLGKSSDPNWSHEGGITSRSDQEPIRNNVDAIALAGEIGIRFAEQGSYVGPKEYYLGTASSHNIFGEYAYAPGDRDGYFNQEERRLRNSKKVGAVSFHRNYKPGLILFNGHPDLDDWRIDGVFDANRVVNATVFTLGYRYESLKYGDFEIKFLTASLNVSMPEEKRLEVKAAEAQARAADKEIPKRPIGYSGKHLGYEMDLSYKKHLGKNVEIGGAGAVAIPGSAWRRSAQEAPSISYMAMGTAIFSF